MIRLHYSKLHELAFANAFVSACNNHRHKNCVKQLQWKGTFSSLSSVKKDYFPHSSKAMHALYANFYPQ